MKPTPLQQLQIAKGRIVIQTICNNFKIDLSHQMAMDFSSWYSKRNRE